MMAETDLVCSKCVGRRTVNNIMMKINSKVMVTTVPPSRPLAYTRRPIFVSASVQQIILKVALKIIHIQIKRELETLKFHNNSTDLLVNLLDSLAAWIHRYDN
jgi:hypothetical protein